MAERCGRSGGVRASAFSSNLTPEPKASFPFVPVSSSTAADLSFSSRVQRRSQKKSDASTNSSADELDRLGGGSPTNFMFEII